MVLVKLYYRGGMLVLSHFVGIFGVDIVFNGLLTGL